LFNRLKIRKKFLTNLLVINIPDFRIRIV